MALNNQEGDARMKKPFYSIGMIFKNEIRCLERCLQSLQPLRDAVPCELVMADTGSSDGSREVAERYADLVFDFPWVDDFSAARNAVMDRCSGQWYISVDADEWLVEGVGELKEFSRVKNFPRDFAGYHIRNFQAVGKLLEDNYLDFVAVRMVRLSSGIRYHGCIHEGWSSPDQKPLQIMTLDSVWFHHDGYAYADEAAQTAKRSRNRALLKRKLEEKPDDLKTLLECIDCVKQSDKDAAVEYVDRAMEGVRQKSPGWDRLGVIVYRDAVSVATAHKLPELLEWAGQAEKLYPDSIFTKVDVAYYAFSRCWDDEDYVAARDWGEKYLKGVADYRAGRVEFSERTKGVLENASPLWERKALVLMPEAYLRCGQPEKAYEAFHSIRGQELEDPKQVELCILMLIRLQRTTTLDVGPLLAAFWKQINQPAPDEEAAAVRRKTALETAAPAFTAKYFAEEEGRTDYIRHGCTVFSTLAGECELGNAAAILDTTDKAELEKLLGMVENWGEFPVYALEHALLEGARFPLPGKPLKIEEMDVLAARMARKGGPLAGLTILAADEDLLDWQSLVWARGLALAAVKICDWESTKQGIELCRAFAKIESIFLPKYYASDLLSDENIQILPPMHRFGWYCGKAFWALDAGDTAGYVRLLREGLKSCAEAKPVVEFLLRKLEEKQRIQATPELIVLAEQVRTLLVQYPADDPAVEALKQSAAYQKVAHLIEGPELGAFGGFAQ